MQAALDDETALRRKRLGRRLVYAVYILFSAAFVLSVTYQLAVSVFRLHGPASQGPVGPALSGRCTEGLRALNGALDRALREAVTAPSEEEALRAFRARLSPEWDDEPQLAQACAGDPRAIDAFTAVRRLKVADEGFVRRQVVGIAPLRREVQAHLLR